MPLPTKILTLTITCRAKLLNADWLRKRAFFLNHEGAFGHQEGMITWYWLAEHACRSPTLLIPHVLWRKAWYKDLPSLGMYLLFHTNWFIMSSEQTAQSQSVGDRLQKRVRLFRYSHWLPRKSILKLANWIFANLHHMRARKRRSIRKLKKASHTFEHWYLRNILAKFHKNPSNLGALLTCLKQGNLRRNKARVLAS